MSTLSSLVGENPRSSNTRTSLIWGAISGIMTKESKNNVVRIIQDDDIYNDE